MEKYAHPLATRTTRTGHGDSAAAILSPIRFPPTQSSRWSERRFLHPPTAIDGVPGYVVTGAYDAIPSGFATLQFSVPEAIFGNPAILFQGP